MPPVDARLATVRARFTEFAQTYPDLRLCADLCGHVAQDADAAAMLTAARPGQDRPVLPEGMTAGGPGTVLGLHRWRDGRAEAPQLLGAVHLHGEWVDLSGLRT